MTPPPYKHAGFVFFVLFATDFFFQYLVVSKNPAGAITSAFFESAIFSAIYWLCASRYIFKASIVFLSLPYLFFIPGWLNTPTALMAGGIMLACLYKTIRHGDDAERPASNYYFLPAFLLIIIYINLSGLGGYGYQSPDFSMHNSRLSDLINLEWPVQYGAHKPLVYYLGFFLPAAMIGKITDYGVASYFLYFWSVSGLTLVFRWLQRLSGWRLSIWLVLLFMLFGSLDILNSIVGNWGGDQDLGHILFPLDIGRFEFITGQQGGFFIGNYLSHTLQLYFAPHQVIAGWLGICLIAYLYFSRQAGQVLFVYALLSLWSPFVMLGMGVLVVMIVMDFSLKNWRAVFTLENTLGALSLLILFVSYYLGGSAGENPSFSIFTTLNTAGNYLATLILLVAGWGIYAALTGPYIRKQNHADQLLFGALLVSLLLLPCWIFGSYSDLFCRGSAPLMFLLMVYLLRAARYYWLNQHKTLVFCIGLGIAAGSFSAIQQHAKALYFYGETQPPTTVTRFKYGWENIGSGDSFFARYFLRQKH